MKLKIELFKSIVENTPLFSIDLVIVDDSLRVLVGKRVNAPAKGEWFVPGGRVYKNETLSSAFQRITLCELGKVFEMNESCFIGLYEHFYSDSFFSDDMSTHYINSTYLCRVADAEKLIKGLPVDQHSVFKLLTISELEKDESVNQFSKVFLADLKLLIDR